MKELARQFIDSYNTKNNISLVTERYKKNLGNRINRYLNFIMRKGVKTPDGITPDLIKSFLTIIEVTGKASSTLLGYYESIRLFHTFLAKTNLAVANPTKGLRPPYSLLRKRTILDVNESSDLINKPDATNPLGLRDRAILGLLYATGMRPTELARLKLSDIDFNKKVVHCCAVNKKEIFIPINEDVLQLLTNYLKESREYINKNYTGDALFIMPRGGAILSLTVDHIIKSYAQKVGIEKSVNSFTLHHSLAEHQKGKMWDLFFRNLVYALKSGSKAGKGGHIWEYFKAAQEAGDWEKNLRKGFANALSMSDSGALEDSVLTLGKLYFAIRPLTETNPKRAAGLIASQLLKTFQGPTRTEFKAGLLDEADYTELCERLQDIYIKTVPSITQRWGQKEIAFHPWSWTSKALHFTKPEFFPILDSLTYYSWDTAIKRLNPKTKRRWPYEYICLLYRDIWDGFSSSQKKSIKGLVSALQVNFELPFFSVIDAFDKHFWEAGNVRNGNPSNILFGDRTDRFIGEFDVTRVKRD